MSMKDRKDFESDEAYLAYRCSLKPDDWSDKEWKEYLEWIESLPEFDPEGINFMFVPGLSPEEEQEFNQKLSKLRAKKGKYGPSISVAGTKDS